MRIEKINVIKGPNYWSVSRHQLIVMLLNLEEIEECPTNKIPGFSQRIQQLLPGLVEHHCSEGERGGFFKRVEEGTWMGHVIEHIALEIQSMAGLNTGFGRTRGTGEYGQYHVVFSYETEQAGIYTAMAAVRIAEALIAGEDYNINADVEKVKDLWEGEKLGPSTDAIAKEAKKRNIPVLRLNDGSYVQFGYGKKQKRIEATISSNTGSIAVENAGCKKATKQILSDNYIPVPTGYKISQMEELQHTIAEVGFPVTIKPHDGNHGNGVTTNIDSYPAAVAAFHLAKQFSNGVLVEQHIAGFDYRVLVIDYKFVAAAKRSPACVTGDGHSSILDLIKKENKNPLRGDGHQNILTKIELDEITHTTITEQGYCMEDVPEKDQVVYMRRTANLSTGGTAKNVTDTVHPDNIKLFERAARIMGLDICGLDIIAPDLSRPIKSSGGVIIEVNAAPGFRMHLCPSHGKAINVAKPVVDMLFPDPSDQGRIPVIAITGTNGKTTTTRLIASIIRNTGKTVGYTTSDGIYIADELIKKGDCSGPYSAQVVLKDPTVDVAVLECARGGILRSGLGFDKCDIAVVTNVSEDHLGLGGIDTIEKLARVKSVVPESVKPEGYAILNADDNLVYGMKNDLKCNIALFSLNDYSDRIQQHCRQGGIAAYVDQQYLVIQRGSNILRIEKVENIPLSFKGKAKFNIYNLLAGALAGYLNGLTIDQLRSGMLSFQNGADSTPGRMNVFNLPGRQVIVDYAHNSHGLKAVGEFINTLGKKRKIGIIAGVGDRRDEDIISYARLAAVYFDIIIIRHDEDLRGRTTEILSALLRKGIESAKRNIEVHEIASETKALQFAVDSYTGDDLIFHAADNIEKVLELMKAYRGQNKKAYVTG
ncbi:MAG: cyanophycin synthetase [Chitinophagaceae bacterium]|nr:cyanophycin synthetase [Chitinophagaceae bacterium]